MAARIKKKNIVNFDQVNNVWNIEAVVMCDSDTDLPDADAFAGYHLALGSLAIDVSTGDNYRISSDGDWSKNESGGGGGGGGGGGDTPANAPTVKFIDYDGTVLHTYTKDKFNALTEMPKNPSHTGLIAQGWNWDIENVKTKLSNGESVTIGQMYATSDGKTRLYIELEEGRLSPILQLYPNGTVTIDWGDGSAPDTLTGTSTSTIRSQQHVYGSAGKYVITIDVVGEVEINGLQSSTKLLVKSTENATGINVVYSNSIKYVNVGNNIKLGNYAFSCCYSLSSITIPDTVTSIGSSAFYNCYSLTSVTIPDTVTSISGSAFSSCYSLTSVTIPDIVTIIDASAFSSCYSLTSVTIPDTVTSISGSAFKNCYSLSSITIPDTVTSITSSALYGCYSLSSITIPDTVTSIGNSALYGCYSLSSITIPDTVTSIGNNVFQNCNSLSTITIPDTVTSIVAGMFQSCYSLSSITIPDTVTSIGTYAFSGCYSLGYIKFKSNTPPTVTNSNTWLNVQTDCKIYVPSGSLSDYTGATNYPDPSTYTYIEY